MTVYVWIFSVIVCLGSNAPRGAQAGGAGGIYTPWSSWSDCTATCGNDGIEYHVRFCIERHPHGTGQNCSSVNGTDIQTRGCRRRRCPTPKTPCDAGLDLALVVDKSSSIGKNALKKLYQNFLPEFLGKFSIAQDATHVGIVLYSPHAELVNQFKNVDYQNRAKLIDLVKNLPPTNQWGTRADRGLEMASNKLYTTAGGDRTNRKNVLVLIGDGRTRPSVNVKVAGQVSNLRNKKTDIVALGYGRWPLNMTQLREVAGDKVYNLKGSPTVQEAATEVENLTCALDGGYSVWGFWSVCSATCGRGVRVRVRTCSNPAPAKAGKDCDHIGEKQDVEPCEEANCPKAPSVCKHKKVDIAMIIDRSSSVKKENIVRIKTFLMQLVSQFDVSPTETNFGIILYSGYPHVLSKFGQSQFHSNDGMRRLIESIPNRVITGTRTDRALVAAAAKLFTPAGGDRQDADNIAIVMTDGKTRKGSAPYQEVVPPLKVGKKAKMIAFGVGSKIDNAELEEIAGENVYHGSDFQHLYAAVKEIVGMTCQTA